MKKILLLLVAVLFMTVSANSQAIYGYGFSINEGTYNAITDGTIIALGTDEIFQTTYDDWGDPINNFSEKIILPSGVFTEETTAAGFPIGFDFIFNEKTFTSFGLTTDGVIYLGNEEVTVPQEGKYVFTRDNTNNLIGFVANRYNICNDETVISYKLEGEAPNRTLVIEFKNYGFLQAYFGIDAYYFDVQFRLYEGTNAVEFVVNGVEEAMTGIDDEVYETTVTIGIKGEGEYATSVFEGTMTDWVKGVGSSETFTLDNTVLDGTTFALSAPVDVVTPEVQPTNLVVNQYSTQLTGSFSAVEGADTYLLVYQEGKEITTHPTDKVSYNPGDNVGDAIVVEYYESWDYEDVYEFEIIDLPGGTDYTIAVYAINAFGTNGPVYNTVDPLTVVTYTKPEIPVAFEFTAIGDTTAVINLTANGKDNKIIVVYNTELVRDSYGDYPLIGELSGEYVSGQEIEGGGKVAYFGEADENIEVSGLEHSTGYFFEAYSYDPVYGYSTDKQEKAMATVAHLPYTLDFEAAKTYDVPAGWTINEGGTFQVPSSVSGYTSDENPYLIWCQVNQKDATNGIVNQLTSCPIMVDQRDAVVKFDYTMYYKPSRFVTDAYNDWTESDVFAIQVSTDGETFEDLVSYNYENHAEFIYSDTLKPFVTFEGELNQYEGQQIWIRIHWHLFSTSFLPGVLVMDNFTVEGREIPETPVVKVEDITHVSARVTWRGAQEDYEVAFAKTGDEFVTSVVEGAKEITFNDLDAETEYQVKVRGIAAENDYSYWSEISTFTTEAWPECDAPTGLEADVTLFAENGTVTLTWLGNEEHLSWDVRYRDANTTSWNTIEDLEDTSVVLESLEGGVTYLWNVRAYCIADRVTDWSAQNSFETPEVNVEPTAPSNVTAVATGSNSILLSWDPVEGAMGYGIYYYGEFIGGFYPETIEYEFTGLESNTEYCFSVSTITEIDAEGYIVGETEPSEQACATTEEGILPPNVTAEAISDSEIVLSWDAVDGALAYGIYMYGEWLGGTYDTSITVEGLSPETEYCFTVISVSEIDEEGYIVGFSAESEQACATTDGIGVAEFSTAFNIYPNPANDVLFVENGSNIEQVTIYNVTGVMVYNEQCTSNNVQVNVADLEAGVYIIKVRTENNEVINRFVKK